MRRTRGWPGNVWFPTTLIWPNHLNVVDSTNKWEQIVLLCVVHISWFYVGGQQQKSMKTPSNIVNRRPILERKSDSRHTSPSRPSTLKTGIHGDPFFHCSASKLSSVGIRRTTVGIQWTTVATLRRRHWFATLESCQLHSRASPNRKKQLVLTSKPVGAAWWFSLVAGVMVSLIISQMIQMDCFVKDIIWIHLEHEDHDFWMLYPRSTERSWWVDAMTWIRSKWLRCAKDDWGIGHVLPSQRRRNDLFWFWFDTVSGCKWYSTQLQIPGHQVWFCMNLLSCCCLLYYIYVGVPSAERIAPKISTGEV